jgi:hypothetical protein
MALIYLIDALSHSDSTTTTKCKNKPIEHKKQKLIDTKNFATATFCPSAWTISKRNFLQHEAELPP